MPCQSSLSWKDNFSSSLSSSSNEKMIHEQQQQKYGATKLFTSFFVDMHGPPLASFFIETNIISTHSLIAQRSLGELMKMVRLAISTITQ